MKTYEIRKSETRSGYNVLEHGSKKRLGGFWYAETMEKAEEYKNYLDGKVAEREGEKAERRARRSSALKALVNPWKVGQLFHHSWGYEQTNCDFFECVAVTQKTVTIRAIASTTVPGSEGFMSDRRGPVAGAFLEGSQPLVKTVQAYVNPSTGEAGEPYISGKYGSMSPCNPEESFYCSWYA